MNWTKASAISEILASIAILVTLIYLAVEINQNAEANGVDLDALVTCFGANSPVPPGPQDRITRIN